MFNWFRRKFKKEQLPEVPKQIIPKNPEDRALLRCFKECKLYGETRFPSGMIVPAPPKGFCWLADQGMLVLREESNNDAKSRKSDRVS